MSTSLATTENESRLVHESCGLVDRSERGKLALTGGQAKEFLNGQVTNDVELLEPGSGLYAAFLTHKGKMLGDVRVLDLGDELWLDTERSALQALFDLIRRFKIGYDVELHKRTLECALLSLVGPSARAVAGAQELPSAEHSSMRARRGGVEVVLVATADGIDVICAAADAPAVKAALAEAGAVEVSEAAADLLRVEAGRPRFGVDIDDTTIPQEAGLNDRAVSFTKGCYVGQETVARLFYKGKPNRHLRGLRLSSDAVATGDPLRLGDREVGRVGTVTLSPTLGPIALALVRREAEPGATLAVGEAGATATVVELPFA
jgi:folate-binding protein YgfZ